LEEKFKIAGEGATPTHRIISWDTSGFLPVTHVKILLYQQCPQKSSIEPALFSYTCIAKTFFVWILDTFKLTKTRPDQPFLPSRRTSEISTDTERTERSFCKSRDA